MSGAAPGLIVAAPSSGAGKTTVTLALLRAFRRRGLAIASAKIGPDYIDPRFHEAATGRPCRTLDGWAMRPGTLAAALDETRDADLCVIEGVMGLFDGAPGGAGSTADMAAHLGLPVLLVLDVARQGQSAAAVARGFRDHRPGVAVDGVLANRVGSPRHGNMVRDALAEAGIRSFGALPRDGTLSLPSRHLGLVQAEERDDLEALLDRAAAWVETHADLNGIQAMARAPRRPAGDPGPRIAPPGQRIALARDAAFAFVYPHLLEGWRTDGAEILPFSPLAGAGPDATADAIVLPGGYPELHAGPLSANAVFLDGLRDAAARGAAVIGECGGYMALGETLIDGDGTGHRMAGLLPVTTSFAEPRLHLGYRAVSLIEDGPLGSAGARFRGHEHHHAREVARGDAPSLFAVSDSQGLDTGLAGARIGAVAGSFVHLIDREAP